MVYGHTLCAAAAAAAAAATTITMTQNTAPLTHTCIQLLHGLAQICIEALLFFVAVHVSSFLKFSGGIRIMYNGIGLQTARGSGTNGYVQKNMSFVNHKPKVDYKSYDEMKPVVHRKPNKEILEHEAKRRVEVKLLEYRDKLEEMGLKEPEIDEKVESHRTRLLQELAANGSSLTQGVSASDTHGKAAAKEAEMERVRGAWGISSDHVEGESFDPEAQHRRREERKERQHKEFEQRQLGREKREQEMRERQERAPAAGGGRSDREGRRDRSGSRDRHRHSSRSPPRARHFDSDSDDSRDGERGSSSRRNRRDDKSERSSRQRGGDRRRSSRDSSSSRSRSRSRSPRRR